MKKLALLIIIALVAQITAYGQIGIGTTAPSASSILDLTSTTQGFLAPRMTYAQLTAISNPATGLLVYQTNSTPGFYFNYGTPAAPDWRQLGLGVTTPIGSGTPSHLAIWSTTSSLTSHPDLYWDNTNRRLGIGTTTPTAKLNIAGTASENQFNITAFSTQSQDILQILGSAGQRYVTINDSGKFIIGGNGVTTGSNVFQLIPQGVTPTSSGTNSVFELDANDGLLSDINIRLSDNAGGIPAFFLSKSRGTLSVPVNLASGDRVGVYGSRGYVGGSWNDLAYVMSSYQGNGTTQTGDLSFWTSNAAAPALNMYISPTGNIGIGTSSFNATNPERLIINAGTGTINAAYAYGSLNNYLQFNLQNNNTGNAASSEIRATADNGNDTLYSIGIGIRGTGYTQATRNITSANDGFLITNGGNLVIGTGTTGKEIKFHTAGTTVSNERMRIDASGRVGIGTSLPNASAIVDMTSTTRGLLIPRMTNTQIGNISSPVDGLLVYQTNGTTGFYYYSSGSWNFLGNVPYVAGTGLSLSGLSFSLSTPVSVANGSTGATSFTAGRLLFGNGTSAINTSPNLFWVDATSRLGIGTTAPATALDVNGSVQIGTNGTTITEIIYGSVTRNIASFNPDQTENFTINNAQTGSTVIVTPGAALPNGCVIAWARVSAANTVQVQFRSVTGAAVNPNNMTYYFMVIR